MITTSPTTAKRAYAGSPERSRRAAEHDMRHWQRILAGSLSDRQRYDARCELVRAAGRKARAERAMEEEQL